jgi:teichoic acid transport system permease protein
MAFPRLLMPLASVRTAFFRFLPTVPVLIVIHALASKNWSWSQLLALYFLLMLTAFGFGLAALVAALQVYFRDTSSFLPYFLRIWLYLSPVLWFPSEAPERFKDLMVFNPLFSMIGGWNELFQLGEIPPTSMWVAATVWAILSLVGGSLFFMSRERDFAVRI